MLINKIKYINFANQDGSDILVKIKWLFLEKNATIIYMYKYE